MFLQSLFSKIIAFFTSDKAKKDAELALNFAVKAIPVIAIAADFVTSLTPTKIDDIAYAAIKAKYPSLFDGSIKTGDDLKLYMLGVATELLKAKFPTLSTTVARTATQLAYIEASNKKTS